MKIDDSAPETLYIVFGGVKLDKDTFEMADEGYIPEEADDLEMDIKTEIVQMKARFGDTLEKINGAIVFRRCWDIKAAAERVALQLAAEFPKVSFEVAEIGPEERVNSTDVVPIHCAVSVFGSAPFMTRIFMLLDPIAIQQYATPVIHISDESIVAYCTDWELANEAILEHIPAQEDVDFAEIEEQDGERIE